MRSKSTSGSLVRISIHVIHCDGGPVTVYNSLTSLVLQGIFFLFLVSLQLIMSSHFSYHSMQDLPSLLNAFFQEAAIPYLCGVPDSIPRPSEHSCWSNSGFSLLEWLVRVGVFRWAKVRRMAGEGSLQCTMCTSTDHIIHILIVGVCS
jgi:hypothetical protein